MSTARHLRTAAAAVLVLGAAGCGSSGSSASPGSPASPAATTSPATVTSPASATPPAPLHGTVTVFAAASLKGTFTTLGRRFQAAHPGTTVRFSFGASSTLAQQVVAGAPADVFASASTRDMARVTTAGDAATPVTFATNTAEIAVAPGSRARVTSVADLGHAGVKVALCQPQVPCGALARTVLDRAGVAVHPVTLGLDVKSTLAYVTSGEADAAVVYVTDVRAAGSGVVGIPVPAAHNATTSYPIATVENSRNTALADAFERYVTGAQGRAVLSAAGFGAP